MKDHYSRLECISSFFCYKVYLRDKSRSSLAQQGEFKMAERWGINFKKSWHKKSFLKMAERWGINIYDL